MAAQIQLKLYKLYIMRRSFYTVITIAAIGLASCGGSAENNDAAADSTINDTVNFNTTPQDSLSMVDSAVKEIDGVAIDSNTVIKPTP